MTEEYFYDTYKLSLSRICAFTTGEFQSWRSRVDKPEEHLLPAFDVNVALSVRQVVVSSLPEFVYALGFSAINLLVYLGLFLSCPFP